METIQDPVGKTSIIALNGSGSLRGIPHPRLWLRSILAFQKQIPFGNDIKKNKGKNRTNPLQLKVMK
jgi:hypothetical protein